MIYSTHHIQEAERYGDRLLVLADGESPLRRHPGPAAPHRETESGKTRAGRDFETAFVDFLAHRGH